MPIFAVDAALRYYFSLMPLDADIAMLRMSRCHATCCHIVDTAILRDDADAAALLALALLRAARCFAAMILLMLLYALAR